MRGPRSRRSDAPQGPGYVYMIGDGDYVKIGTTGGSVWQRMLTMQVGNPRKLQAIDHWAVADMFLGEVVAHEAAMAHGEHVRGEWFVGVTPDQIRAALKADPRVTP